MELIRGEKLRGARATDSSKNARRVRGGRRRDSEEGMRKIPSWYASNYYLGFVNILKGHGEEAREKAKLLQGRWTRIGEELAAFSYVYEGRYRQAVASFDKAIQSCRQTGDTTREIRYRLHRSRMLAAVGDPEGALRELSESLRASQACATLFFSPIFTWMNAAP